MLPSCFDRPPISHLRRLAAEAAVVLTGPGVREAIERLGNCRMATHLARAHLVYGEWLRHERRRQEARHQLRTAHQLLADMGAAGFAERAARELRAPFNGKLVAVHATPGARVARGEPLLVIESMKLEHTLAAPRDVTVEALSVAAGQQVAPGQLLLIFSA